MELFGLCIAKVNASLVIEELQVFYEPKDMIAPLMKKPGKGGFCSFCRARGEDDGRSSAASVRFGFVAGRATSALAKCASSRSMLMSSWALSFSSSAPHPCKL